MPSEQVENYLKNIFKLQTAEEKVTTSLLSERLDISSASVSEMIKKLAEEGTLKHTPYKGVELTKEGEILALKIIRRHRLWEMFLVQVLHFQWDEIDEEAERFEHIMSQKMEDKIDKVLDYPTMDPHGDPIPQKDGTIKPNSAYPLSDAKKSTTVRVVRVSDTSSELLQYLSSVGIVLHKKIFVKECFGFDNSLIIKIHGQKEITISNKIAMNIFVEKI